MDTFEALKVIEDNFKTLHDSNSKLEALKNEKKFDDKCVEWEAAVKELNFLRQKVALEKQREKKM